MIPREIIQQARTSYGKYAYLIRFSCASREALVVGGRVVGFVTPHLEKWGWRHGPMFVLPLFRGRGLVEAYYAAHPERLCVAFVEHTNPASRKMHSRAGFLPWRKHKSGIYMRRLPLQEQHDQEEEHSAVRIAA